MDGLTDKEFKSGVSRRGIVVGTLSAGFALSVQPIMAQTAITTSTQGLEAGEVKVKTADGDIPAYRAMPATGSNFPTVMVVQEIFGVHEYIKDVCRRFAKAGYFAIAPELYARQGDVSKMTDIQAVIRDVVSKVPDKQVMADLDATVAYAKGSGKADTDKLGITGFCWGGRVVWLYAAHNPNLKAGVAWYGRMVGQASEMTPKHPIDLVAQMNAAVLGLYGGADTGIPLETVQQMEKALSGAGKKHKFVVYPEAPHAFHADYRPSYRKEAAEDGWKQALAWFKANGVG
ncbi:MAG: dienelactone hydrolase family protein [Reyranellaceae bacterium]